ncbi:MAG: hypothetical protein ABSG46_16575 [Candidatus Binataceae bacterium]|jgi:hypothetical protein
MATRGICPPLAYVELTRHREGVELFAGAATSWISARSNRLRRESLKTRRACAVAEREGFAPRSKNFVRQAEREQGREKGWEWRKTKDWDDEKFMLCRELMSQLFH